MYDLPEFQGVKHTEHANGVGGVGVGHAADDGDAGCVGDVRVKGVRI